MKILKVLANLCGVCFLCIGILLYIVHDASQNIISGEIVNQISSRMSDILASSLESIGVDSSLITKAEQYLPQNIKNEIKDHTGDEAETKIDEIKEELISSSKIKDLSNLYMAAMLDGVIEGKAEMPDIDQDVKQIAKQYIPKLSSAIHIPISEEQTEMISDRLVEKIDLQTSVSTLIESIHGHLSDKQIQALKFIRLIQGERAQWIALGFLVIGLFLVVIGTQSAVKWTWYVGASAILCGILLWLGCQMIQSALYGQLQGNADLVVSFSDGLFDAMQGKGITLCIFGFGCFGGYGIVHQIKKYANH